MKKEIKPTADMICCICHKAVDPADVSQFGHCKTKRKTDAYFHIKCAEMEMKRNAELRNNNRRV